ncbi:PIN domain-containing protein [Qipengyuania sp. XHP0207]|uniref:PIN domain-containing protein n=1 Tax=Qipengyuania sp. XHP0207 TaxID=3038078 RepID=UPI00241FB0B3|nr:PIN domain-containing protein [Qipengyuania sp. XHP0207]MDG5748542.1 PIN domain-containing protein [Qipengyuania sp. XHP0207]
MTESNIVIDANVVLHYQRIDQIDWVSLTGANHCSVIVVPALMRELERKKATGSSAVIKKRAGKAVDFLAKRMDEPDPIALRPGCTLSFRDNEPLIDFPSNRLSVSVDDDHYIASALEVAQESRQPTFIASADSGLKLKLRARPISILVPPEAYRLQDEVDSETKELREAKRELEKIKNARPRLTLQFNDCEGKLELLFPEKIAPNIRTLEEVMRDHPLNEVGTGEITASPLGKTTDLSLLGQATSLAWRERENERIRAYYDAYDQYFSEYEAWLSELCQIDWIAFRIENLGGAAATNVGITVAAPEGTVWIDEDDIPDRPKEPDKPSAFAITRIEPLAYPRNLNPPRDGDVYVREDGRSIFAKCGQLNPGCGLSLEKAVLRLSDSAMIGTSSSFRTRISFTEGEPIEGQLPFAMVSGGVIERGDT